MKHNLVGRGNHSHLACHPRTTSAASDSASNASGADYARATGNSSLLTEQPRQTSRFAPVRFRAYWDFWTESAI